MFTVERLLRAARRIRPRARPRYLAAGSAPLLVAGLAAAPAPAGGPVGGYVPHVDVVAQSPAVPAPSAVTADGETDPVGAPGDAADDMAFWANPDDPSKSVPDVEGRVFSCQDNRNELPGTQGNQDFKLMLLEKILDF